MTQDFADFKAPGNKPILNSIFDVSDSFLGELRLWLEQNPPAIGISNILGFSQFTATYKLVDAAQTTTSGTYADLATTGPSITDLPNGNYVVMLGAFMHNSTTGQASLMSIDVNGAGASDDDFIAVNLTVNNANDGVSLSRAVIKSLSNSGNNTLTAKYRVTGGTGTFQHRWILALRYGNL